MKYHVHPHFDLNLDRNHEHTHTHQLRLLFQVHLKCKLVIGTQKSNDLKRESMGNHRCHVHMIKN